MRAIKAEIIASHDKVLVLTTTKNRLKVLLLSQMVHFFILHSRYRLDISLEYEVPDRYCVLFYTFTLRSPFLRLSKHINQSLFSTSLFWLVHISPASVQG